MAKAKPYKPGTGKGAIKPPKETARFGTSDTDTTIENTRNHLATATDRRDMQARGCCECGAPLSGDRVYTCEKHQEDSQAMADATTQERRAHWFIAALSLLLGHDSASEVTPPPAIEEPYTDDLEIVTNPNDDWSDTYAVEEANQRP